MFSTILVSFVTLTHLGVLIEPSPRCLYLHFGFFLVLDSLIFSFSDALSSLGPNGLIFYFNEL